MAWNTEPGADFPVTPHAAPSLDQAGQLTYVGEDGRRYVVGLPPEMDQATLDRVMGSIQREGSLFREIERLALRWIAQVSSSDLDGRAAMVLLMTTLETSLEEQFPEDGAPEGAA